MNDQNKTDSVDSKAVKCSWLLTCDCGWTGEPKDLERMVDWSHADEWWACPDCWKAVRVSLRTKEITK